LRTLLLVRLRAVASLESHPVLDARRFGRTPVGFIAALAAVSLFALAALVIAVLSGPVPTLLSLVLAVLPVPAVIACVLYLDRLEPEPHGLLALVFGAGAGAAALIALAGDQLGWSSITTPELGPHVGLVGITLGAAILGAAVAESVKGAVLIGLLWFRRQELDGAHDGVVYASMVGLGFALIANLHSYLQAKPAGAGALASAFVLRGILSPLWDPLFSSMLGVGITFAAMRRGTGGLWAVALGWVTAVALRAIWDDSIAAGPAEVAVAYAILLCALAALLAAVAFDRRRIVHLITRYLPAYERSGVVTAADVEMLATMHGRRHARQWARLHGGGRNVRAMADYQLAATELVLACNRADRDLMDPAKFAARCEDSLALMRASTSIFQGRLPDPPQPPWTVPGAPSAFGPKKPPSGQLPTGSAPPIS